MPTIRPTRRRAVTPCPKSYPPNLLPLEPRTLLSADQVPAPVLGNEQVVTVLGTDRDDDILVSSIDGHAIVVLNGWVYGPFAPVERIEIDAGAGDDFLMVRDDVATPLVVDLGPGADVAFGGSGDDRINGGKGPDMIHGGLGDDTLKGNQGADALWGDEGSDRLRGLIGPDRLDGGPGADNLWGGPANDTLRGGSGDDLLSGDKGADRIEVLGTDGDDRLELFERVDPARRSEIVVRRTAVQEEDGDTDRLRVDLDDLVVLLALDGDDRISVDSRIVVNGLIDGGRGEDVADRPDSWACLSCEG